MFENLIAIITLNFLIYILIYNTRATFSRSTKLLTFLFKTILIL